MNGKLHFYGNNPDVNHEDRAKRFAVEAEYYDYASSILSDENKSRFIFCSGYNPWPFVKKFDNISHTIAVDTILEHLKHLNS